MSGFQETTTSLEYYTGWRTKFNCMLWIAGSRNELVENCEDRSYGRLWFEVNWTDKRYI